MLGCENFVTYAVSGKVVYGVLPGGEMVQLVTCPREGRAHWLSQVLAQHQPMKRCLARMIDALHEQPKLSRKQRAAIVTEAENMICWNPKVSEKA